MRSAFLFLTVSAVLLLVALTAPLQAAIIIPASAGAGSSTATDYPASGGGWEVGGGSYQNVYYDPDAGPWLKNLGAIQGGAVPGTVYTLTEALQVGGGPSGTAPAWTDFHEEIQTPGWTWNPTGPGGVPPSWSYTLPGGYTATYVIPLGNIQVDWTFHPTPLPIGTNLILTKYVIFNGGPGSDPNAPLTVAEYPTVVPEPATLSLLALGALAAFRRRS